MRSGETLASRSKSAPRTYGSAGMLADSPSALAVPEDGSEPASAPSPRLITVDSEMDHLGFGKFHYMALAVLGLANASDAVELLCLSFILPVLDGSSGSNKRCGSVDEPLDMLFNATAAVVQTDTTTYTSEAKALLSAGIFIGMLVGGLVFGVAADRYGRRVTLCFSLAVNAVFGLLSALSPVYSVLLICRIVAGFGVGGSIPGVFTLAAELLPNKDRGFWLSTVAWWWMVGSIYAAGLAWAMLGVGGLHWQWYAAVCTLPAAASAVLTYYLLPESPRFLLGAGETASAARAILTVASWNGTASRLSQGWQLDPASASAPEAAEESEGVGEREEAQFAAPGGAGAAAGELSSSSSTTATGSWALGVGGKGSAAAAAAPTLALRGSAITAAAGSTEAETQGLMRGSSSKKRGSEGGKLLGFALPSGLFDTLKELFSADNARVTYLLGYIWFALSFGWYGLILWIPTLFCNANVDLDEFQDSFLVAASNLPGNLLSALLMERIGRKNILTGSLVAACASAICFRYATTEATVVLAACVLNAVSTCSWNSLDCLSTESFPTGLRTSALGFLCAMGRVGSIVGQFVFGSLVDGHTSELLILAGCVLGSGALVSMALPKFKFQE